MIDPAETRALVVGLGASGQRHLINLRRLLPQADLAILPSRGGKRNDPTGAANQVFPTLEDALAFEPDMVIIATPASHHLQFAEPFAMVGIPLLVEKPLADSVRNAQSLNDLCREHSAPLMVAYVLRFHPGLLRLKKVLPSGILGPVKWVRIEVGRHLLDWRPDVDYREGVSGRRDLGGGVLRELSHELDYFLWLFGPVSEVEARVARVTDLEIDVEDHADILLSTSQGIHASIHLDMYQRTPVRTCKVVGEQGSVTCDLLSGEVRFLGEEERQLSPPTGIQWNDLYLDELGDFIACVQEGRRSPVTGEEGIRVLQVIEASERSSQKRSTVSL